jgi:hypothetical protein
MNTLPIEHTPVRAEWNEVSLVRRIEPDWTEAVWFQVWLQLARLPHESSPAEFELAPVECVDERRLPLN